MKSLKKMETVSPPDIVSSFGLWAPTEEGCALSKCIIVSMWRGSMYLEDQLITQRKEEKG